MSRIITLTTDFGLADEYVGVMKGVILSRAPDTAIIDLSNAIDRQNIRQAALLIKSAYRFFPTNTIHLVVVDPDVGTKRKLILLQADDHIFLAPDNGVLGMLLEPEYFQAAHEVQCKKYYLTPVSSTFQGRDILAPVAAHLAAGLDPVAVGPSIERQALNILERADVLVDSNNGTIVGEIINVDHFGNLQTNITGSNLNELGEVDSSTVSALLQGKTIVGIQAAYADKAEGEMLIIIGSRNFIEIAVNRGSAAVSLGAGIGDSVKIEVNKA
jgi:S-adenosylmethionine hydrolase